MGESRFIRTAKALEDYAPSITVILGNVMLALAGILEAPEEIPWLRSFKGWMFVLGSVVSIIGVVWSRSATSSGNSLKEQLSQKDQDLSAYRQVLINIIPDEVFVLSAGFGLNNLCRITTFKYDAVGEVFHLINRYSENTKFSKTGRKIYPANEDVLGRLTSEPKYLREDLPDPEDSAFEYYRIHREELNLSEEVAKTRTMQPRCYLGYAIRTDKGALAGALVLESKDPKGLNVDAIERVFEFSCGQMRLRYLFDSIDKSPVPTPSLAREYEV